MTETMRLNKRSSMAPMQLEQRGQYLSFTLQGETLAMDIRSVREVIQFAGMTEVPLMPGFIRGVINLRGAVVPVIDLAVRFGKPPTEIARRTCIIILELSQGEVQSTTMGVMVDHVNEVLGIAQSEVEPAPAFGSRLRSDFISAVGKVNGRFVLLLDVDRVLSVEEMAGLVEDWEQENPSVTV